MEAAPQPLEAPTVPSEGSGGVSNQTADVLEVVETVQDHAPPAAPGGAAVQGSQGAIQSPVMGPPPSSQL